MRIAKGQSHGWLSVMRMAFRTAPGDNGSEVLIHGNRAKIIGRICMDQMMADGTDIPNICQGDTAILIGRSGDDEITACEWAAWTGTITNEILSRLGERLDRIVV